MHNHHYRRTLHHPEHGLSTTRIMDKVDCCQEPGICCFTFCCPCIIFGWSAEILDEGRPSCLASGLVFYVLAQIGCACLYSHTYRNKLRGLYSLQERPCLDFCVHCWCGYCAICQENRELRNHGWEPAIGWAGHEERMKRAYQVPPQVAGGMAR